MDLFFSDGPPTEGLKEWGEEKRYFRQGKQYTLAKGGGMGMGISIYVGGVKH